MEPTSIAALLTLLVTVPAAVPAAGIPAAASPAAGIPAATGRDGTDAYYADAHGRTGSSLRTALHTIVSRGVTTLSYGEVWDALKVTDQDPADPSKVVLLYSGVSRAKSRNGGARGDWNREHVWPQSRGHFGTAAGPGTDLHHLRPEDVGVNALRGNKDFDTGGGAATGAAGNHTDADSWEPRAAVRGDVARMVLYMAVRYEGDDAWPDLEAADSVGAGRDPRLGRLSTLLRWSAEDPPDDFEKRRNEVIHRDYQHNRNPFIDHPEWVASVFG